MQDLKCLERRGERISGRDKSVKGKIRVVKNSKPGLPGIKGITGKGGQETGWINNRDQT